MTNMAEWLQPSPMLIVPLAPLWSLAVEEQVYLFWPVLLRLVKPERLPHAMILLALASIAWRVATRFAGSPVQITYAWTPSNLEPFAAGAIVAWLARNRMDVLRNLSPRVLSASLFFMLGMAVGQRHFNFWQAPAAMLTIGMSATVWMFASSIGCLVASRERSWLNRFLSHPSLCMFGKYSYSIYVVHASVPQS